MAKFTNINLAKIQPLQEILFKKKQNKSCKNVLQFDETPSHSKSCHMKLKNDLEQHIPSFNLDLETSPADSSIEITNKKRKRQKEVLPVVNEVTNVDFSNRNSSTSNSESESRVQKRKKKKKKKEAKEKTVIEDTQNQDDEPTSECNSILIENNFSITKCKLKTKRKYDTVDASTGKRKSLETNSLEHTDINSIDIEYKLNQLIKQYATKKKTKILNTCEDIKEKTQFETENLDSGPSSSTPRKTKKYQNKVRENEKSNSNESDDEIDDPISENQEDEPTSECNSILMENNFSITKSKLKTKSKYKKEDASSKKRKPWETNPLENTDISSIDVEYKLNQLIKQWATKKKTKNLNTHEDMKDKTQFETENLDSGPSSSTSRKTKKEKNKVRENVNNNSKSKTEKSYSIESDDEIDDPISQNEENELTSERNSILMENNFSITKCQLQTKSKCNKDDAISKKRKSLETNPLENTGINCIDVHYRLNQLNKQGATKKKTKNLNTYEDMNDKTQLETENLDSGTSSSTPRKTKIDKNEARENVKDNSQSKTEKSNSNESDDEIDDLILGARFPSESSLVNRNTSNNFSSKDYSEMTVYLPFIVPDVHSIETRFTNPPNLKQRQLFENLGFHPVTRVFSAEEDRLIQNNWKEFCKNHLEEDPEPFLRPRGGLRHSEKLKFVQYLARGLNNRMLSSVYKRFKLMNTTVKKGRFTAEEDHIIFHYISELYRQGHTVKSARAFAALASILNRDRLLVEKHYISRSQESLTRLSKDNCDAMIKSLIEIVGVERQELADCEITINHWKQLEVKMHHPIKVLKAYWRTTLYPSLFCTGDRDLYTIRRNITELLLDQGCDDWKTIDWREMAKKFPGQTWEKLYKTYKGLVHNYVPTKKWDNLGECIVHLMNTYFSGNVNVKNHTIPTIEENDGDFSFVKIEN